MKYILLIFFLSCTSEQTERYNPKEIECIGFQKELLDCLNEVRVSYGLNSLKAEERVTYCAMEHAIKMNETDSLNHFGFQERVNYSKARRFSEVVNKNMITARSYINSFINSPSHREAILDSTKTYCGIWSEDNYVCINFSSY